MSILLYLVVGLLVSVFALQPVVERASRSKDVQLVTGISGFLYWSSHFLFDVVIYTTCWVLASVIFFQQHSIRADSIGAVVALVLSFPLVALPTAYLTSFVVKSQSLAATIVVVAFSATGIARTFKDPDDHSWVSFLWTLVPPYAFPGSLMKVLAIDRRNSVCDAMRKKWHLENGSLSEACPQHLLSCCSDYQNTSFWYTSSPLGFHRQDVGLVCLSMVLEGVLLFALLSCLDSGIHVFRYSPHSPTPTSPSENLDANVKKEKEAVRKMCSTGDFKGVAVAVDDLSKWYGRRHAVRGLSFALKNHQCLGLLGVNGAGKTTVLQMLSGIVPSSNGEAHMQGFTLSRNRRAWQSNIGYCPQYDGLMNRLTAYEQLRLFARLRGVPPGLVERAVTRVVWMVGLEEWACKQCFTYSGGNKRKLSLAMAIIGVPKLLLLDEPLSGVDAIVRRRIVTGLRLAMESLDVAVVFGTHSVQECEALCDTVGVMAAGELKFLGSFGSLKERFQTGCIVRFKLNVDDQQSSLAAAVSKELPGIDLRDAHEGTLVFHLKQGIPWSVLFDKLDRLRETFAIEEAIVSDMTSGHALSTLSSGESDALSFGRS
ncbi:phospholipid-transporting ATPase ABCA3-like [Ixodes scapularis]